MIFTISIYPSAAIVPMCTEENFDWIDIIQLFERIKKSRYESETTNCYLRNLHLSPYLEGKYFDRRYEDIKGHSSLDLVLHFLCQQ